MKCGPIYKQVSDVADGKYDGRINGYEITFQTEAGEFMTRCKHFGTFGANAPVVVIVSGDEIEVEVKK